MNAMILLDGPECAWQLLEDEDFSGMSRPILVAAQCEAQVQEFIARAGLMPDEARMICSADRRVKWPEDKVLLLLPGWSHNRPATGLVDWWDMEQDRYTYQMPGPTSWLEEGPDLMFALCCLAVVAALGALGMVMG